MTQNWVCQYSTCTGKQNDGAHMIGKPFRQLLTFHIDANFRTVSKLAEQTGISENTIRGWLKQGKNIKYPRYWQDVIKIASALNLNEEMTSELLKTSQHPNIDDLISQIKEPPDCFLLEPWLNER